MKLEMEKLISMYMSLEFFFKDKQNLCIACRSVLALATISHGAVTHLSQNYIRLLCLFVGQRVDRCFFSDLGRKIC